MLGMQLDLIAQSLNGRRHQRYPANCLAKLEYLGHGIHGIYSMPCRLENISVSGAAVRIPQSPARPDHYYLLLPGFEQRIGCGVAYRDDTRLGLMFLRELNEDDLQGLVRSRFGTRV